MKPHWIKVVDRFCVQETPTFQDGAPQREEYGTDEEYEADCVRYRQEWQMVYRCRGCKDGNCPQCGKS